mgnify:CR=1 FL=1
MDKRIKLLTANDSTEFRNECGRVFEGSGMEVTYTAKDGIKLLAVRSFYAETGRDWRYEGGTNEDGRKHSAFRDRLEFHESNSGTGGHDVRRGIFCYCPI